MHTFDQKILGIVIVLLLVILVGVKRAATGSILEKPEGNLLLWLVNIFNLFFLLIANPLAAILLSTGQLPGADPTSLEIGPGWLLMVVEVGGVVIYLTGFFLMGWALIRLGSNYQLGGSDPRAADIMIVSGPYAFVRHPMYTAALCIAFGLACLIESLACFGAFIIYLALILLLIPVEEESLMRAYGEQYAVYQRSVGKLVPLLF
jgi:protein-S-isoprenylcysteine O-methyltransferase Ste14